MKNKTLIFISIFIIVAVSLACGKSSDTGGNPQPGAAATRTPDYSGPCANVLYPFIPGRQWIYQRMGAGQDGATPDPLTSKFGLKVEEIADSRATLTSLDLSTGATTQTTAECREGAITSFPLLVISSLFGNYLMGDIQSEYVSGVFAPSKAELDAADWNMEWEGEYVTSGTVT